jgi:hypothetical protein
MRVAENRRSDVPSELTDPQRAALQAFAAATESPRTHLTRPTTPRASPAEHTDG